MIGNIRGYTTVEAAIIVPVILLIIALNFVLLIGIYEYSNMVLESHRAVILEQTHPVREIKVLDHSLVYRYVPKVINGQSVQETIEYTIYLMENYYDRIVKGKE